MKEKCWDKGITPVVEGKFKHDIGTCRSKEGRQGEQLDDQRTVFSGPLVKEMFVEKEKVITGKTSGFSRQG